MPLNPNVADVPRGLVEPPLPLTPRRERLNRLPGASIISKGWDLWKGLADTLVDIGLVRLPHRSQSKAILSSLYNSQVGMTGVIVCNGPSLNKTDFSLIAGLPVILLNRGYLLHERLGGPPTALCVSARPVLEQYADEIAAQDAPLVLFAEDADILTRTERVAYVAQRRQWRFTKKIDRSMNKGYTVTFTALQLAYHLGWQKTIIIGLDHSYDQTGNATVAVKTVGHDPNHFDPNYFGNGVEWILPDLVLNDHSYRLARAAFEKAGRQVVDSTVGGHCEVFEKVELAEAVS